MKHVCHIQCPKLNARNASRQFCVNTGMTGYNTPQTQQLCNSNSNSKEIYTAPVIQSKTAI